MVRARYVFDEPFEKLPHLEANAWAATEESENWSEICSSLEQDIIGKDEDVTTPFGIRRVVYSDYTASGRSLHSLESHIKDHIMTRYGNVHTLTTATARQSTFFRTEARRLVRQYFNLDASYAAIFCGAGSTAAVEKFVRILEAAAWDVAAPSASLHGVEADRVEDRWGSIECRPCKARLKSEAAYRAHCATEAHKRAVEQFTAKSATPGRTKIHILIDPTSHHSLSLPFREAAARAAAVMPRSKGSAVDIDIIELSFDGFILSLSDLDRRLADADSAGALPICLLCAASNVTGGQADVAATTARVHRAGGLVCWDIAGLAAHRRLDVRPASDPLAHADALFASPHKLLGGPSTCGLLLVRKALMRNDVPATPGGGTVFFVGPSWHSYITNCEEREEAGSPDLLASVRTGLVYHLHMSVPRNLIEQTEARLLSQLLRKLAEHPRVEVLAPEVASGGCGIVSFVVRYGNCKDDVADCSGGLYLHHGFVSCLLNDLFGVQSRAGCACAGPLAQKVLGISTEIAKRIDDTLSKGVEVLRPGFTRVGVHFTDSEQHAEIVREAICWIATHGWRLLPQYTFDTQTGEWSHRQDTRDKDRAWLSTWRPAGLAEVKQAVEPKSDKSQVPTSFQQLARLAEDAVLRRSPGRAGAPVLRCSADLLWFALPQDAAWALNHGDKPALAPDCNPFADVGESERRPHEPLFSARAAASEDSAAAANDAVLLSADQNEDVPSSSVPTVEANFSKATFCSEALQPKLPKPLVRKVHEALADFDMIVEGDRVLVGLSGGKDSLTLLHVLLEIRRTAPVHFEIGAATVDPQAAGYDPSPLVSYLKTLGVEYFLLKQNVIEQAKLHMDPKAPSICSFCARMKRGILYRCMRENNYNILALGQHLDDIAESFLMSAFFNGMLRTMKANYWAQEGDIRIIRPLIYLREEAAREAAEKNNFPIIADNCPACFAAPKERHKTKLLLSSLEFEHKDLFPRLLSAVGPLLNITTGGNIFESAAGQALGDDADEPLSKPKIERRERQTVPKDRGRTARSPAAQFPQCQASAARMEPLIRHGERAALLMLGAALGAVAIRSLDTCIKR